MNAPKQYAATSLETAACLWEAVLEMETGFGNRPFEMRKRVIQAVREKHGTRGLRMSVLRWVDAIDAAWDAVDAPAGQHGEYGGAFDWEFIPDWIALNVVWPDDCGLPYVRKITGLPAICLDEKGFSA